MPREPKQWQSNDRLCTWLDFTRLCVMVLHCGGSRRESTARRKWSYRNRTNQPSLSGLLVFTAFEYPFKLSSFSFFAKIYFTNSRCLRVSWNMCRRRVCPFTNMMKRVHIEQNTLSLERIFRIWLICVPLRGRNIRFVQIFSVTVMINPSTTPTSPA